MRPVSILFLLVALTSCATSPHPTLERFEFTRVEMGMPFTIVLHAANTNQAERAATAAFDRVRALNAIFSDYEDDSELTQLSRSSGKNQSVPLSPELWDILERAQDLAERTQGAFDVTVGPYVSLWRRARRQREMPRPDLMQIARERVGYAHLHLNPVHRTALLAVPRMRLDLGGIAKGYALDEALRVLDRHGFPRALVSGGGDIVAGDPPPGHQGWRIALTPLDDPENRPAEQLLVSRRAVATSGDLFQYVEIVGRRYSHIVDPRTGLGLTQRRLVTVIATDSTTADSLATSLSVLGPEAGLNLAAQFSGVEARVLQLVHGEIQTHATRGFSHWIAPPD